jgi:hypothetical protein
MVHTWRNMSSYTTNSTSWKECCVDGNIIIIICTDLHSRTKQNTRGATSAAVYVNHLNFHTADKLPARDPPRGRLKLVNHVVLFSFLGMREIESFDKQTVNVQVYQPRMIADRNVAFGEVRIHRGNRNTRTNPAPDRLCPPQRPHKLIGDWTRVTSVRIERLTT